MEQELLFEIALYTTGCRRDTILRIMSKEVH